MTIWRMRTAYWIPKVKNTHSHCLIFVAFPLQQWLHEHTSMLLSTYIAYLVETDRNRFLARAGIVCFLTSVPVFPGQKLGSDLTTTLLTQQVCERYVHYQFWNCGFLNLSACSGVIYEVKKEHLAWRQYLSTRPYFCLSVTKN